jgi:hypothetical protein
VDLHQEAKLMGYENPTCAQCRYALIVPQTDHGLCRRHPVRGQRYAPLRTYELCQLWEPRWGVSQDSPLMQLRLPARTGQAGSLGGGW